MSDDSLRTLLGGILEAADAFDRCYKNLQARFDELQDPVVQELRALGNSRTLLTRTLEAYGLQQAPDQVGEYFSPNLHTCSHRTAVAGLRQEIVVEEFQPAYLLDGSVFRKAVVATESPKE